jgi:Uma2 family endonuclease
MTQVAESSRYAVVFYPSEREGVLAAREMCFEDYLALDVEGKIAEWVDGEARIYMNVTSHHARVVSFLDRLLGLYCEETGAGTVLLEPYAMRARVGGNAREPDLMFIAEARRHLIGIQYLDGPCDVAVEVISPDSPRRDREEKFAEYAADSVPEYWIIDPRPGFARAEFYSLVGAQYEPLAVVDGAFHSRQIPGFWMRVAWLWDPQPRVLALLDEILGPRRLT